MQYGNVPTIYFGSIKYILFELNQIDVQCTAMQMFCSNDNKCYRCLQREQENDIESSLLLNGLYEDTYLNQPIERLRFDSMKIYDKLRGSMNEDLQLQVLSLA